MGLLRLAVLGPPEVVHEGRRLTFALRKAEALLLYLAVEGGLHSRSKLAAFLWPDNEPPAACTALRNALALLRSLLANLDAFTSPHSHLLSPRDQLGLDRHAPGRAGPGGGAAGLHRGPAALHAPGRWNLASTPSAHQRGDDSHETDHSSQTEGQ